MSRSLSDCNPALAERYLLLAEEYVRRFAPWSLRITRTLSTAAEQAALYAQGRNPLPTVNMLREHVGMAPLTPQENVHVVTNLDGIRKLSNHQGTPGPDGRLLARAIDVVPLLDPDGPEGPLKAIVDYRDAGRFSPLGPLAAKVGLYWGGDWHRVDMPHLELPAGIG